MGSYTDYFEQKIAGKMLLNETYTPPSTWYLGLFTAAAGEAGGGIEVASGGGYARQSVALSRSGSTVSNSALVEFPVATGDNGTVVAVGLFDAETSGNLCGYHTLASSKTYNTGDQIRLQIGALTITHD